MITVTSMEIIEEETFITLATEGNIKLVKCLQGGYHIEDETVAIHYTSGLISAVEMFNNIIQDI